MQDLCEEIRRCFSGSVCLMGLGNADYGDDGFGVQLADSLARRLNTQRQVTGPSAVITAGTSPERFIGTFADEGFDHLIFLDAVEFGGEPGSVVFLGAGEIIERFPQVSTHKISLGLLASVVEENGTTKAWLLGVQPGSLKTERCLTPSVQTTLALLDEMLWSMLVKNREAVCQRPHSGERVTESAKEKVIA